MEVLRLSRGDCTDAEVHDVPSRYRNAEMQRCSGRDAKAEVQMQRRMFRHAGAEVQVQMRSGAVCAGAKVQTSCKGAARCR